MNDLDRINLQKMIQANDTEDQTAKIREYKHSDRIRADVVTMLKLKQEYQRLSRSNPTQFDAMCVSRCNFLFNHYTDIFNKLKKDEIDLNILMRLLNVLKMIEDGKVDQHEGSFEVGKILKQIYIDSAIKKAEYLDAAAEEKKKRAAAAHARPVVNVSWAEYKKKLATEPSSVKSGSAQS